MTTTVADAVEELAGIIKLSVYSSFSLFNYRKVVNGSKSPYGSNEEYIGLCDNKYIGDLLVEFKAGKDRREIMHCKLVFKMRLFRESDEAVPDLMFIQLSYVQLQHDYSLGNYPVGIVVAAKLSALQMAEIGYVDQPESFVGWTSLFERYLPRQIANTRAKREWVPDIISFLTLMGDEIQVVLETHIHDVMLRRYSEARSAAGGSNHGDFSQTTRAPGIDIYEKRVQELSKAAEESQKNANQLLEEMRAKLKHELEMQEPAGKSAGKQRNFTV